MAYYYITSHNEVYKTVGCRKAKLIWFDRKANGDVVLIRVRLKVRGNKTTLWPHYRNTVKISDIKQFCTFKTKNFYEVKCELSVRKM